MKINWKVRFRNKTFLTTFIITILGFVYAMLDIFGVAPKIEQEAVKAAVVAFLGILAALGIVTDPTTVGIEDSDRAMSYKKPNDDSNAPTTWQKLFIKLLTFDKKE